MDNNNRRKFLKDSGMLLGGLMLSSSVIGKEAGLGTAFGGTEPLLGEIGIFAFGRVPRGWMSCDGQILGIKQNSALYALLGIRHGGDGQTTFALPNLNGRTLIAVGPEYPQGAQGGEHKHSLALNEMPMHNHKQAIKLDEQYASNADSSEPDNAVPAINMNQAKRFSTGFDATTDLLVDTSAANTGAAEPHENMQPSLVLNFCIAVQGIYPPRS